MENRSSMGDLSNSGPGFPQGEGPSDQTSLQDLPDILSIELLNDEPEISPELNINLDDPVNVSLDHVLDQTPHLLPDSSVDALSGYNPFIDVPSTSSEIIPMHQEFMADIQNDNQLQTTHNLSIEVNPGLGVGLQYQNQLQEFGNEFSGAAGLSKDLLPNLKREREAIMEGSQSGLTDGTNKLIQAGHKNEYKKRKFLEKGETSSRIHTQQQPLPSNSGTSSINPGLLEHASEDNFGGFVGNLAGFPPSYSYPQLVPNLNPSSSLPYLHTPQTSQLLAHTHGVTGSNPIETPHLGAPPPISENIPLPNPQEGTSQPNDDKEWSLEDFISLPSDSSD
ncbi:hypothetical protein L2E82_43893 [Cichorium intybus]|uniref:Uncharacterized protein n=1 Tax=Cichorium intybus TaxID=13427 RepID=A0ACB8ZPI3_CICIN|nr:hypothetical protein L2E82_43893 [Cichorium intybus]